MKVYITLIPKKGDSQLSDEQEKELEKRRKEELKRIRNILDWLKLQRIHPIQVKLDVWGDPDFKKLLEESQGQYKSIHSNKSGTANLINNLNKKAHKSSIANLIDLIDNLNDPTVKLLSKDPRISPLQAACILKKATILTIGVEDILYIFPSPELIEWYLKGLELGISHKSEIPDSWESSLRASIPDAIYSMCSNKKYKHTDIIKFINKILSCKWLFDTEEYGNRLVEYIKNGLYISNLVVSTNKIIQQMASLDDKETIGKFIYAVSKIVRKMRHGLSSNDKEKAIIDEYAESINEEEFIKKYPYAASPNFQVLLAKIYVLSDLMDKKLMNEDNNPVNPQDIQTMFEQLLPLYGTFWVYGINNEPGSNLYISELNRFIKNVKSYLLPQLSEKEKEKETERIGIVNRLIEILKNKDLPQEPLLQLSNPLPPLSDEEVKYILSRQD